MPSVDTVHVILVGLLSLLTWLVKSVISSMRQQIVFLQNHMTHDQKALDEIREHMGSQTEINRAVLNALLARRE